MDEQRNAKIVAAIVGTASLAWATLSQANEIASNSLLLIDMIKGVYPLLRDWGWLPLLALSIAILIFGLPQTWPKLWRTRRETISLKELVDYVTKESVWFAKHPTLDDKWIPAARLTIEDQLSLGKITAYGRPNKSSDYNQRPLELIPQNFWRDGHFSIVTDGDDPKFWNMAKGAANATYSDVRVETRNIRKLWPALSNKVRVNLLNNFTTDWDSQRIAAEVSERLAWSDRDERVS